MTEIVLRARVFDHSGEHVDDTFWERAMDVGFVPDIHDSVQLWAENGDGPLAPVKRRWWQPDGRICVALVPVVNNGDNPSAAMEDGRLQWVPVRMESPKLVQLLRSGGWDKSA